MDLQQQIERVVFEEFENAKAVYFVQPVPYDLRLIIKLKDSDQVCDVQVPLDRFENWEAANRETATVVYWFVREVWRAYNDERKAQSGTYYATELPSVKFASWTDMWRKSAQYSHAQYEHVEVASNPRVFLVSYIKTKVLEEGIIIDKRLHT